jgi:hypothetical protein
MADAPITTNLTDATLTVRLSAIERIDLRDIVNITSHRIMRTDNGVVHEIEFKPSGGATISYTNAGEIREFSVKNGITNISEGGTVITVEPRRD